MPGSRWAQPESLMNTTQLLSAAQAEAIRSVLVATNTVGPCSSEVSLPNDIWVQLPLSGAVVISPRQFGTICEVFATHNAFVAAYGLPAVS